MFGFHEAIWPVTWASNASPPAPSPTAASTKGWPDGGVVPLTAPRWLLLTGGVVTPLLKVTLSGARSVRLPSFIWAATSSRCGPSTQRAVGRVKVYGD